MRPPWHSLGPHSCLEALLDLVSTKKEPGFSFYSISGLSPRGGGVCVISLVRKLPAGVGVGFVMAWSRPSAALGVSIQCEILCT